MQHPLCLNWANQTEISLNANCFQTAIIGQVSVMIAWPLSTIIPDSGSVHWAHCLLSYGDFISANTLLLFPLICIGWSRPLAIYFNTFEIEKKIDTLIPASFDTSGILVQICITTSVYILRIWVIRVLSPKIIENNWCSLLSDASIHLSSDLGYIFLLKTKKAHAYCLY